MRLKKCQMYLDGLRVFQADFHAYYVHVLVPIMYLVGVRSELSFALLTRVGPK